MAHVELPVKPGGHITLVHFPAVLSTEQGAIICEGLEVLGEFIAKDRLELYWLQEEMMGRYHNVRARLVEDAGRTLYKARARLLEGLMARGIPFSSDYAEWIPHVTGASRLINTWSVLEYEPRLDLVQKPHRVSVPFG